MNSYPGVCILSTWGDKIHLGLRLKDFIVQESRDLGKFLCPGDPHKHVRVEKMPIKENSVL